MGRFVVDISNVYYDYYPKLTDFAIIHLSLLSTQIENYNYEVQLAIL